MKEIFISVGSNYPSGEKCVREALRFLEESFTDVKCSSVYMTPSVGTDDASVYYNAVVGCKIDNDVSSIALQEMLKSYEVLAGRTHGSKEVIIDLDLVVFDGTVVRPVDFSRRYFTIGYEELNH